MKRYLVIFLLIIPCLALSALDMGFGANAYFLLDTEKQDTSEASLIEAQLVPSLVLMISPRMELHPFVFVGISKESDPDAIAGLDPDLLQFSIGAGSGLYYHFFTGNMVRLSMGPRATLFYNFAPSGSSATVYDSYFDLVLKIGLPVNFDVQVAQRLILRTGVEIFGAQLDFWRTDEGGVIDSGVTFTFLDYFTGYLGNLQAYVGFYFLL